MFLPVIMFSVLFGLSMDYEVFLVSRIHEQWLHTGDNRMAVTTGQTMTGRVITAAATIMILVFLSFLLADNIIIKQFGVGLAMTAYGPAREADGVGSGTGLGLRTPRLARVADSNAATTISPIEA